MSFKDELKKILKKKNEDNEIASLWLSEVNRAELEFNIPLGRNRKEGSRSCRPLIIISKKGNLKGIIFL